MQLVELSLEFTGFGGIKSGLFDDEQFNSVPLELE
jgi:hypothetical protein